MTEPAATGSGQPVPLAGNTGLTEYIVVRFAGDGNWKIVQAKTSKTSEGAIRAVVEKLAEKDQSGKFVAVPARSWKPVDVAAKFVTTLEIKEAR